MRTAKHDRSMTTYAVLATVAVLVLGPGWTIAAYDQDNQPQDWPPYEDQDQRNPYYQQPSRSPQVQGRDMPLEQQIAGRLRQQGYGARGEIMILATGNRVILLGTVPDNRTKEGVERVARQVAARQSMDNRLHVNAQAKRVSDARLVKDTYDKLGDDLRPHVRVWAQNGTVTLEGQLDDWQQVADAIDTAFAAGATQVNSRFVVAGAGAMARDGAADGSYPPYGYAPRDRPGPLGGRQTTTSADLRLARQVASRLRQQLPQGQDVQAIQPQSIYVTVQQGIVILYGYVQSGNQKQQAERIVQSIRGVRNVLNDLTIVSTRGAAGQAGGPMGSQPGYGGTSGQSRAGGSFPPQGYFPDQSSPARQGRSGQDQYSSESSAQQGFGGQNPYDQDAQVGVTQAGISPSDMALAQKVVQQLKQQLSGLRNIQIVRPGTIYVMATQGGVLLYGSVQNPSIAPQAAQIARAIPGVRYLESTLHVAGAPGQAFGYIPGQEQPSQQGMAPQDQGTMSQSQGSAQMRQIAESGQTAAGQSSQSDTALAQQVALKLRQQLPSFYNVQIATPGTIYVKVSNGAVTLDGFVSTDDARQRAEQVAKSVSGVQSVKNSLSLVGINQTLDYAPTDDDPPAYRNPSFDGQPNQERQQTQRNGSSQGEPY
jgi:osmotically-inducible protein OsmY